MTAFGALRLSSEVENAVIVAIVCDRGDRYLSTGVYDSALDAARRTADRPEHPAAHPAEWSLTP